MAADISNSNSTCSNFAPDAFQAAFDATAEERAALFPSDFITVNLDVPVAVTTVLATLPRLKMLREEIVSQLPMFDIEKLDRLQTYAEALSYAQSAFTAESHPSDALPSLVERGMIVREQLLSDAKALAHRGLIDGKRIEELKGGTGYLNVGSDIGALVRIFRERWNDIHTKSALQVSEIDEANQLYQRITFAVAERAGQSAAAATAADDRQRAFVLVVRAYDEAKRAAGYIRWHQGDADKILPSLWTQRGAGRPSNKNDNGNTDVPATPATPDVDTQPALPAAPAAPPVAPVAPVAPGLPGGSPFAHN